MSVTRIDLCDVDALVNQITVGDIVHGKANAKFITLKKSSSDKSPVKLQLSSLEDPLKCPFGAKNFGDAENTKLSVVFDASDSLIAFISALENRVQSLAMVNSQQWFKKDTPPRFNSILDTSKPQYPTRFKTKMVSDWVKVWVIHQDEEGNQQAPVPGNSDDLCAKDFCVPIIKLGSIWSVPATGYGLQTTITDICILKKPQNNFAFDFGSAFANVAPKRQLPEVYDISEQSDKMDMKKPRTVECDDDSEERLSVE